MTSTKATGPFAVLEAAFKIIPGKKTDFQAFQPKVVPLARHSPVFGQPTSARFGTRHGCTSERALTVRSK